MQLILRLPATMLLNASGRSTCDVGHTTIGTPTFCLEGRDMPFEGSHEHRIVSVAGGTGYDHLIVMR